MLTFDDFGNNRHVIALFKGDTSGGQVNIDLIHFRLFEFGQIHAFLLIGIP
ncbi:hypothetical protein D3C73_1333370 [compost metagenome]